MSIRLIFAALFIVPPALALAADVDEKPKLPSYKLPDDPQAAVIVMDYTGGQVQRVNQEPVLTIRADGKVILGNPYGQQQRIESQITPTQLQRLLDFVIEENKFFQIDPAKIREEIQKAQQAAGGLAVAVADAATVHFRVQTADESHEVKYYALRFHAAQYEEIEALQQLRSIEERLSRGMTWIRAGGREGVEKALEVANQRLAEQYPEAQPLTAGELESAYKYADGRKRVTFRRTNLDKEGKLASFVIAELEWPAEGGEPKVTIRAKLE